jgi:flotillin
MFRVVVETNEVHIVQSGKNRVSYGGDSEANSYYNWPSWIPGIGNVVTQLPLSVFDTRLERYEAYDKDKVPFSVDIFAQFEVVDPSVAAQKISHFSELKDQLSNVLKGVVRATLSTKDIEAIMLGRREIGTEFQEQADEQVKEYGVRAVFLEFMNIEDTHDSSVISDIQEKRKSAISRDSRIEVAENTKAAKIAEIEATREKDLANESALEEVGVRSAERKEVVGLRQQKADQAVREEMRVTEEKTQAVARVRDVEAAAIAAEAKEKLADGELYAEERKADAIKAVGQANAEAQKEMELAPVQAKIDLADAINERPEYMKYLETIKELEVRQVVDSEKAKALASADIKIISSGGGDADEKINGVLDVLSSKGGSNLGAMVETFKAVTENKGLMDFVNSDKE